MADTHEDDVRLAHVIADQVDNLTMGRFSALEELEISTKPDETFVTDADRDAEELVRAQLARARPRDAVVGEEFGAHGSGTRRWIIDPIDGTHNFLRGVPVWATLIALADGDEVKMGMVSAPALHRRWWGATGLGAWTGRSLAQARRLRVSQVSLLSEAFVSYSSMPEWDVAGLRPGFDELCSAVWRTRGFGDFWQYMLVAEGAIDICAEPSLALHDMAALAPIVTEAGGRFTDLDGNDGPWGTGAVASNGLLHGRALASLYPKD